MRKFSIILLTAAVILGAGLLVIACEGGFVDPGHDDVSGFGNGGGGGGGKPAKLGYDATYGEMRSKLNEIINYSGTPSHIKAAARLYIETISDSNALARDHYGKKFHIDEINSMIGMIP
ncbi:MAG: hypothetical protein LBO04_06630 [Spirochaetaceae bacterium]|jgi:hypothetical protein|nr:hypothetical protein [Spirochaetaceae bacterium]